MTRIPIPAAIAALAAAGPAAASSDDAWQTFRDQVAAACTALARPLAGGAEMTVEVDPFGSESHGVAIVTLVRPDGRERMICITDKTPEGTGAAAELTAPVPDG